MKASLDANGEDLGSGVAEAKHVRVVAEKLEHGLAGCMELRRLLRYWVDSLVVCMGMPSPHTAHGEMCKSFQ